MTEFWDSSFKKMQTLWGFEPSDSAIQALDFFQMQKAMEILIPGIGYGRNAKLFCENGFNVTGIEISRTAIGLARTKNDLGIEIHHGSVTDMPFDNKIYDGIFCYALLHLLNLGERRKFIGDCYRQLKPGGHMIFVVVSKKVPMYGEGKKLSTDRFERLAGVKVFFYDEASIKREFRNFGLVDISEIDEPIKHMPEEAAMRFIVIRCGKGELGAGSK
jgi:SAM-dependent methyltransferase